MRENTFDDFKQTLTDCFSHVSINIAKLINKTNLLSKYPLKHRGEDKQIVLQRVTNLNECFSFLKKSYSDRDINRPGFCVDLTNDAFRATSD